MDSVSNFANPDENIKALALTPGSRVADFGAGSGAYAIAAARIVGDRGRVYAIDIQKELLSTLAEKARGAGVDNVEVIWGDADRVGGTKILESTMDAVILSNILFQSEEKLSLALEAKRVLKPGGKVLLIDWSESFGGLGPSPAHIVPKEEGERVFVEAGFSKLSDLNAGAHHWGTVFTKPS